MFLQNRIEELEGSWQSFNSGEISASVMKQRVDYQCQQLQKLLSQGGLLADRDKIEATKEKLTNLYNNITNGTTPISIQPLYDAAHSAFQAAIDTP